MEDYLCFAEYIDDYDKLLEEELSSLEDIIDDLHFEDIDETCQRIIDTDIEES